MQTVKSHQIKFLLLIAIFLSFAPSTMAQQVELMTCTGTQSTNYTPGLRLYEQDTVVSGTNIFSLCEGTENSIQSALIQYVTPDNLSCLTLAGSGSGQNIVQWSDGTTSTFSFTVIANSVLGQLVSTFTGAITSGRFDGNTAAMTVVAPAVNLTACLGSPGLTEQTGVSELVIYGNQAP